MEQKKRLSSDGKKRDSARSSVQVGPSAQAGPSVRSTPASGPRRERSYQTPVWSGLSPGLTPTASRSAQFSSVGQSSSPPRVSMSHSSAGQGRSASLLSGALEGAIEGFFGDPNQQLRSHLMQTTSVSPQKKKPKTDSNKDGKSPAKEKSVEKVLVGSCGVCIHLPDKPNVTNIALIRVLTENERIVIKFIYNYDNIQKLCSSHYKEAFLKFVGANKNCSNPFQIPGHTKCKARLSVPSMEMLANVKR